MVTRLRILSVEETKTFDNPPLFTGEQRKQYFYINKQSDAVLSKLRDNSSKAGYLLQLGYFKATNRFFSVNTFHEKDLEYIARLLQINRQTIKMDKYGERMKRYYQNVILQQTGSFKFTEKTRRVIEQEAQLLAFRQTKLRQMFLSLVDYLKIKKCEVPSYAVLNGIISKSIINMEKNLVETINNMINAEDAALIDELLDKTESTESPYHRQQYTLTLLKTHSQSIKSGNIRDNIQDYEYLEKLFFVVQPIMVRLNLSAETVKYYADIVLKSQVFQISRRDSNRYLYLIAFIVDSFYELNDMLVAKLKKAVQQTMNSSSTQQQKTYFDNRIEKADVMKKLSLRLHNRKKLVNELKKIMSDESISADDKVNAASSLLNQEEESDKQTDEYLAIIDKELARISKNADYYDTLELKSRKLQGKISEMIKHFHFDEESSDASLMEAIHYFRDKNGHINDNAPLFIFNEKELKVMFDEKKKIRVSLYKVLLFIKITHGIKSGSLNLVHSYDYKAFENYLIKPETWLEQKQEYLERCGLSNFKEWSDLEAQLKGVTDIQYKCTNRNIENESNSYIRIDKNGKLILIKQENEDTPEESINLFPSNTYVSIYEILAVINEMTGFLNSFEHLETKYSKDKPDNSVLFAGIIGYGCNIGIRGMSKISRNINVNQLVNTVKWRFTLDNINEANDKILKLIGNLELSKIFKKNKDKTHTSSDGQKFNIAVESINANKSFKYFAMDDGVVVNSFIDESHRLFYSVVMSPADRESAYVIDALLHNNVVKSDIHSTDTHGYNEIVFGVTHMLGISFAPRIKNFRNQHLYSFENVSTFKKYGYKVLPYRKIKTKVIEQNWDNILRMVATLKSREATASQLFKRLSSYSRQHPMYNAIKEFGKIIKTLFILKYIDDPELRSAIQKMLNKIESSNKFAKAVFYGRDHEFQYASRNEQLLADACKRLIENAIICWNYAYLTKMIAETQTAEQKHDLLETIKAKSVVAWGHVNLAGTYDFSEESLSREYQFKLEQLLSVTID